MKDKRNITSTNHVETKQFAYSRNGVNLSFSLRTDIKQELKDFLELLQVAAQEVERELKK